MLKNISWKDFLIVIFFLTATYYLALVLLFHRHSIRGIFRKGWHPQPKENAEASPADKSPTAASPVDDFTATKEAADNLKIVIHRAVADRVERQDLLNAIRVHLQPYKRFKGTAFAVAIQNSIVRELQQVGYSLTEDELTAIWL